MVEGDPISEHAKRILELFDEIDRKKLDLHTFLELAGSKQPDERLGILDAVDQLVNLGAIKALDSDFYERTELGVRLLKQAPVQ
jgi:hypothetical protein